LAVFFAAISLPFLVCANNDTHTPPSAPFHPDPNTNVTTVRILDNYGEQSVAFYVSNGYTIVEGDIGFDTVEEFLNRDPNDSEIGDKWPNTHVLYKYDSVKVRQMVSVYIDEAIRRWKRKNPFLKFTEVSEPNSDIVAGVVRVTATECGGCYAGVAGYSINTEKNGFVLNLQQSCGLDSGGCSHDEATHEMGRVLGLVREVQSRDRDKHVIFHCENIVSYEPSCCSPPHCDLVPKFAITDSFNFKGTYRHTSVTQYGVYAPLRTLKGVLPEDHQEEAAFSLLLKSAKFILPDVLPFFNYGMPDPVDYERICGIYIEECKGVCGNGIFEPENGEECDDGNNNDFDTCSNDCKKVIHNGDGCSSTCLIEPPELKMLFFMLSKPAIIFFKVLLTICWHWRRLKNLFEVGGGR